MRQWIIIGLIAVVLVASYLWNRNRNQPPQGETLPPVEEVMVKEDGSVVKKIGETEQVLSQEEAETKKQEIKDKTANAPKVELAPETGSRASGTAARVVENGTYYQSVSVAGLTPTQKGYYYEAWLQNDGDTISLGRLTVTGSTGELLYASSQDRSDYNQLVISYEVEDGNKEIGTVVLKGNLSGEAGATPTATPEATAAPQSL